MKRVKFQLIQTTCKRCGVSLYTGNRSLYGHDREKAKYDRICAKCITAEEQNEINKLVPIL
jgi:hypothetical protein